MKRYTKDDVQTRSGRPCVNVKVYASFRSVKLPMCLSGSRPADQPNAPIEWHYTDPAFTHEWIEQNISDDAQNAAFEMACQSGWESIQSDATDIFGAHVQVYSEGRSGGWAMVHGLLDLASWDAVALAKWRRFEKYARATAADVPRIMIDSFYMHEFWPANEAAQWAESLIERTSSQ